MSYSKLTYFVLVVTGGAESLVVKFADGGPKKRQQTQQNGMIHLIWNKFV